MLQSPLTVANDTAILEAVSIINGTSGYEIKGLLNTDDLINHVHRFRPELILLEWLLSSKSTRKLTQQLEAGNATKNIPVLRFSACPDIREIIMSSGSNTYIPQPLEMIYLVSPNRTIYNVYSYI
jgi:DNA-binding response OmpR family regulator